MQQQRMNTVKQKLLESGVIGDVVNDFSPRVQLYVIYRRQRISLDDELSLDVAQSRPDNIECECDDADFEMKQILTNSKFVIVMTDPQRTPGSEYLHWLITDYDPNKRLGRVLPWEELVAYEPPTHPHKIVFTLFRQNQSQALKPQPRVLFSTRIFAASKALGSPLAAAFCHINVNKRDQNESSTFSSCTPSYSEDVNQNDQNESSTCSTPGGQ